jgi:hypothetical protein
VPELIDEARGEELVAAAARELTRQRGENAR